MDRHEHHHTADWLLKQLAAEGTGVHHQTMATLAAAQVHATLATGSADVVTTARYLGHITPVEDQSAVCEVLTASVNDDGRSDWVWVRLANGDLLLATYPRGDTYEKVNQTEIEDTVRGRHYGTTRDLAVEGDDDEEGLVDGH